MRPPPSHITLDAILQGESIIPLEPFKPSSLLAYDPAMHSSRYDAILAHWGGAVLIIHRRRRGLDPMATHLRHTGLLASDDKNWKPDLPRDHVTATADLGLVTYISDQSVNTEVRTLSELC